MARQRNGRNDDLDMLPGAYERLSVTTYRGVDPRIYVSPEDEVRTVQAVKAVTSPLIHLLDASLPVVVPKWRISGNSNPGARQQCPWLAGPGNVRVWPSDEIEETFDETD